MNSGIGVDAGIFCVLKFGFIASFIKGKLY